VFGRRRFRSRSAVTALPVSHVRPGVTDDESEKWGDPPSLSADTDTDERSTLVGPFSFPDLVFGAHALVAVGLTPFLWNALQAGNLPLVGSLALLVGLLLYAGVTMRRIAARR
jgi:hypothetical protein